MIFVSDTIGFMMVLLYPLHFVFAPGNSMADRSNQKLTVVSIPYLAVSMASLFAVKGYHLLNELRLWANIN